MGADVVIAVDISTGLLGRETLRSVLDVTEQLTNLLTRTGLEEQRRRLGPDDILVRRPSARTWARSALRG